MKKNIPHIITLTSLSIGFLSIIESCNLNFITASYLMIICLILDSIDGTVARYLNTSSKFGKELDSLSDMIAFGIAPGILIYHFITVEFSDQSLAYLALLIPICSSLRLANYNTYTEIHNTFSGLTTPVAALCFLSIPLINEYENNERIIHLLIHPVSISLLTIIVSILLIAPVKTFGLRLNTLRRDKKKLVFIFISISIFYIFSFTGLLMIILTYIILSVFKIIN